MNAKERDTLLETVRERFEHNQPRHRGVEWAAVRTRLLADAGKLRSLGEMERTGGEPDIVRAGEKDALAFFDCAAETPSGRRSLCYDEDALDARKEHKPQGSALGMAAAMGIALLTETQYRALQKLGEFDLKTSSWIATPANIRKLGGALFCDRRYGTVFVYHNGVQSYYAARGFRGALVI